MGGISARGMWRSPNGGRIVACIAAFSGAASVALIFSLSTQSIAETVLTANASSGNKTADVDVEIASTSADGAAGLLRVLNGIGQWRPGTGQFTKFELRFRAPVELSRAEIHGCDSQVFEGAEVYLDFDRRQVRTEGGKSKLVFALTAPGVKDALSSLAFNLRYNSGVCISAVKFFNGDVEVHVTAPVLAATVSAAPATLFDSRLDTAWRSEVGRTQSEVVFEGEVNITGMRVWTGDQRSRDTFKARPRAKVLLVSGDNGFKETVQLADRIGAQSVALLQAYHGRVIRVRVEDAFGGPVADATISEIQFTSGRNHISPDVTGPLRVAADMRRMGFQEAKLSEVLDRTMILDEEGDRWIVRLRSDGTLFVRGNSDNLLESRQFSFLGQYVIEGAKQYGLRLRVNGYRVPSHMDLDGSNCGRGCGEESDGLTFVEDVLSIRRPKARSIFISSEKPKRSTLFGIRSLRMKVAHGED